jgi:hypothetical protein
MSDGPTARAGEPWLLQDVINWLCSLGLQDYAPAFRARAVDGPALLSLQNEDLLQLTVSV